MSCDIENIFGSYINALPNTEQEDGLVIINGTLPVPPTVITTDKIYIKNGVHDYLGNILIDLIDFFANKRTYRGLGLLIFSIVFSEIAEVEIILTHKKSDVKKIRITNTQIDTSSIISGYYTKPFGFVYYPSLINRHPWYQNVDINKLPYFSLTNERDFAVTDDERAQRDIVDGFGCHARSALLAELLLNIGCSDVLLERINLESLHGFTGVDSSSAEARFWIAENDEYSEL